MKRLMYNFVKQYVSYCQAGVFLQINDILLDSGSNMNLIKIRELLQEIQKKDEKAYINLLKWEADGVLFDYLKIIKMYYEKRVMYRMKCTDISRISGIPLSTVKRIEYLQSTPTMVILIKMIKAIDCKLEIND